MGCSTSILSTMNRLPGGEVDAIKVMAMTPNMRFPTDGRTRFDGTQRAGKTSTQRKRSLEFLGSAFFEGFMKKVSHNPENLELYTFRHNQRPKKRRYD